jgi:hypothetical protein
MRVVTAQRRNYGLYRNLRRAGIGVVLAGGLATGAVTQRHRITDTWTKIQRHGVSKEWAAAKHKVWELWVAIRSETPWPVVEEKRSAAAGGTPSRSTTHSATATHTAQHHTQVAATTTKRKSKRRGNDINTPGSTP